MHSVLLKSQHCYNTPVVTCFRPQWPIVSGHTIVQNSCLTKTLLIVPNDAHYYKIIEMLKQFYKFIIITLAPTCFGSRRNHHQGAVLCFAKTTNMVYLCGIDVVNVMAAYQPVVQACGSQWRQLLTFSACSRTAEICSTYICTIPSCALGTTKRVAAGVLYHYCDRHKTECFRWFEL